MSARDLIESAFERLTQLPGFTPRDRQVQLALFLFDLLESGQTGAIEAPTGLGKSLAALIPAIAHAIEADKRAVVSTYTNVLADQYWRKDLPLALSLFERSDSISTAFLMGRGQYACLIAMDELSTPDLDRFKDEAELGSANEFRRLVRKSSSEVDRLWRRVVVPPVCPARLCPAYQDCYLYSARRKAEKAHLVVTNHSVTLQDALNARSAEDDQGLLGAYDFLILDEAHDFIQAAQGGLEFDLSLSELRTVTGVSVRLEQTLAQLRWSPETSREALAAFASFRAEIESISARLRAFGESTPLGSILGASPATLEQSPQLASRHSKTGAQEAEAIARAVAIACEALDVAVRRLLDIAADSGVPQPRTTIDTAQLYLRYLREIGGEAHALFEPEGVTVAFVRARGEEAEIRRDVVGLAEPLRELLWDRKPYAALSATLALDGSFDFFKRTLGCEPEFEEILPSPFDYATQAALYVPRLGAIPDPSQARAAGEEDSYYDAMARELTKVIRVMGGRTLALFHSRKEMHAVYDRMQVPDALPIFVQPTSGAAQIGAKFKSDVASSLFALRSFWTGFDAPGDTLSCVAVVRAPFEVPMEPTAIARMAYLESQGLNPFQAWTLPMAKMLIRQGVGRLIRSTEDRGLIALLDPRIRTKFYGEELIANLPPELRQYDDVEDAVGWLGLDSGFSAS